MVNKKMSFLNRYYKDISNCIQKLDKNKINSEAKLLAELFELKGVNFISENKRQFAISFYNVFENKLYLFNSLAF